ncbi:uncharacterized protein [Amphiura filiformis]|uniref:uncharacterized protein n=1 Tax=Amphiura filiformis TaxID=82378 RepID=UPI003B20C300
MNNMASIHIVTITCIMMLAPCLYSLPLKHSAKIEKRGTTDDCYGTNCYYDPDYEQKTEVTFPENLTDAIMSALPRIASSQTKIVDLLNRTLASSQHQNEQLTDGMSALLNIEASQMHTVVLLNQTLTSSEHNQELINCKLNNKALKEESVTLMEKNEKYLENLTTTVSTALQSHDEQLKNLTSTISDLLGNVVDLLQNQLNVLKTGFDPLSMDRHNLVTKQPSSDAPQTPTLQPSISQPAKGLTTTEITSAKDCQDLAARGHHESGAYTISPPDGLGSMEVFCDMETDGGGWIVFQRRFNGSLDFFRSWNEYNSGFGNPNSEYWLGLQNVRRLVSQEGTSWILRIDLEAFDSDIAYAVYDSFMISNAESNYTLSVGSYSGNAGDSLQHSQRSWIHNGMQFSTHDRDNDLHSTVSSNCASDYKGGWWYNGCHAANLNGWYLGASGTNDWKGMIWHTWKGKQSLKRSEMKIRRLE